MSRFPSLLALVFLLPSCRGAAGTPAAEPPPVTVASDQVLVVSLTDLASGPGLSGTLVPARQATLRAEVAGMIMALPVETGERVSEGSVLVRLDDAVLQDQVRSAESSLRVSDESLALARRNLERTERLAAVGAMAEQEAETMRVQATSAEANRADAQARLAAASKQLARTVVRAPFPGVVSERPVHSGDVVQVGAVLVTMVDPASLRLEAMVPVQALPSLAVGTPVDFDLVGAPGEQFTGQVERLNPAVDPATGQVRLVIGVDNRAGRLVAGLFARGRVTTHREAVLAVPTSAVSLTGPTPVIRRLAGGRVEEVAVTTGMTDAVRELVAITGGLAPGDTVLVGSAQSIAPGTRVRIRKE